MKFSKHIKKYSMNGGFTFRDLEKQTGVGKSSICRYERGESFPTPKNLLKISKILGVQPSDFMEEAK